MPSDESNLVFADMRHAGKALPLQPLIPLPALAVGEGDLRKEGLARGEAFLSGLGNWGLGFDEGNGDARVR